MTHWEPKQYYTLFINNDNAKCISEADNLDDVKNYTEHWLSYRKHLRDGERVYLCEVHKCSCGQVASYTKYLHIDDSMLINEQSENTIKIKFHADKLTKKILCNEIYNIVHNGSYYWPHCSILCQMYNRIDPN